MKKTYIKPQATECKLLFIAHLMAGSELRAESDEYILSREQRDNNRFTEDTDETWEWE